jgi:hypothetical protein
VSRNYHRGAAAVTLPSFLRRTYTVTGIALAGLIGTLAVLLVLDARAALFGALLAPWVAVIGWDLGVRMRNDVRCRRLSSTRRSTASASPTRTGTS